MIKNCNAELWEHRSQTVYKWGKDQTGSVEYCFNSQGFRSDSEYTTRPDYAFFGNSCIFGIGVDNSKIATSFFENSHNYGLAGTYSNQQSVDNFTQFINSDLYSNGCNIIFGWKDLNEPIDDMIQSLNKTLPGILHISFGQKRPGAINLLPQVDADISGTHPGPNTHYVWAKTIKLLIEKSRK